MIDLISRVKNPPGRGVTVTLSDGTGWPSKGDKISVVMNAAGQSKTIEGVVVSLDPQTSVSPGRLVMVDNATGAMITLPAPRNTPG